MDAQKGVPCSKRIGCWDEGITPRSPPSSSLEQPGSEASRISIRTGTPFECVYKREVDTVEEVADKSYEPDQPSGEQGKLRYCRKQNWLKGLDNDKGIPGEDEGPDKGSAGRSRKDSDGDLQRRSTLFSRKRSVIVRHSRMPDMSDSQHTTRR